MADILPIPARTLSGGIASLWQIVTRALRTAPRDAGMASRITDETTLREFDRLDEERLRDIGIRRRPRRIRWLERGRGMSPVPMVEFDYLRLDR